MPSKERYDPEKDKKIKKDCQLMLPNCDNINRCEKEYGSFIKNNQCELEMCCAKWVKPKPIKPVIRKPGGGVSL